MSRIGRQAAWLFGAPLHPDRREWSSCFRRVHAKAMYVDLIVGALLVVFGFALGFVPPWLDRHRRLSTHRKVFHSEILMCAERLDILMDENVMAPLYPLPTRAFEAALNTLVAKGQRSRRKNSRSIRRENDDKTAISREFRTIRPRPVTIVIWAASKPWRLVVGIDPMQSEST